jgi:multiple sugar transport system substrate-binding protein
LPKTDLARALDRRRFLTGAASAVSMLAPPATPTFAQTAAPTPVPARIQTPDLAFVGALQSALTTYGPVNGAFGLRLSIVPAEPASDQLLNDARSGARSFSGALVPNWLIPDLVRDDFILPVDPPPAPLPPAIARLRSFGGDWVSTDLDHDCDLLFYRRDLLDDALLKIPLTWDELERQAAFFAGEIGGGIALPQTHTQQVVDHFAPMAASFVIDGSNQAAFWFDPETMDPMIASPAHQQALDTWQRLAQTTPAPVRGGSTGDLWHALLDGSVAFLIASTDFLPFALERGVDQSVIGAAALPGRSSDSGEIITVGNAAGASWGGVVMRASSAAAEVAPFLSYLATPDVQRTLWSDPSTGITPDVAAGAAPAIAQTLETAGWPSELAESWTQAIESTLSNPFQLPPLRIAETRRYLQALEDRVIPFLASEATTSEGTLALAADDWRVINEAIGIGVQHDLYGRSLAPPPAVARTS